MLFNIICGICVICGFTSCSDDEFSGDPAKDWAGTTTFFASTDAQGFGTYYMPSVGRVGDPMPFYDQKAGDFKVLLPSGVHQQLESSFPSHLGRIDQGRCQL